MSSVGFVGFSYAIRDVWHSRGGPNCAGSAPAEVQRVRHATLTGPERREFEEALRRLEAEQLLLTDGSSHPQGSAPAETVRERETLDRLTLVDGRIRQLRRWLEQG